MYWVALASGHLGSFDRRKCKGRSTGRPPPATTAPRAGRCISCPARNSAPSSDPGSAEASYYVWVDWFDTFGLGRNVPIIMGNLNDSILAWSTASSSTLRVPYPMGMFAKNVDGRIDDPNAGWKGKALWTTTGTRTFFHNEGGKQAPSPRRSSFSFAPTRWRAERQFAPDVRGACHRAALCAGPRWLNPDYLLIPSRGLVSSTVPC